MQKKNDWNIFIYKIKSKILKKLNNLSDFFNSFQNKIYKKKI